MCQIIKQSWIFHKTYVYFHVDYRRAYTDELYSYDNTTNTTMTAFRTTVKNDTVLITKNLFLCSENPFYSAFSIALRTFRKTTFESPAKRHVFLRFINDFYDVKNTFLITRLLYCDTRKKNV